MSVLVVARNTDVIASFDILVINHDVFKPMIFFPNIKFISEPRCDESVVKVVRRRCSSTDGVKLILYPTYNNNM